MGLVLLYNITATICYELVLCCTSYIDSIKFIQPVITNPPPFLYNIGRGGGLILLDEFYEVITNSWCTLSQKASPMFITPKLAFSSPGQSVVLFEVVWWWNDKEFGSTTTKQEIWIELSSTLLHTCRRRVHRSGLTTFLNNISNNFDQWFHGPFGDFQLH